MINKVQDGKLLHLTVASTVKSGEPIMVGNAIAGVAQTSYNSADGKAVIDTEGVFDLSVKGVNDAGNVAVAIGDRLYYTAGDTPVLNKKVSGKFFGIALETVDSGSTTTINVKIGGQSGLVTAPFTVIAAGINVVNDSPLAAAEFIPVTGILATDVVVCTLSVNSGSPSLYILSAIAAASPAGITVTASGTFAAGDKINYLVLRAAA